MLSDSESEESVTTDVSYADSAAMPDLHRKVDKLKEEINKLKIQNKYLSKNLENLMRINEEKNHQITQLTASITRLETTFTIKHEQLKDNITSIKTESQSSTANILTRITEFESQLRANISRNEMAGSNTDTMIEHIRTQMEDIRRSVVSLGRSSANVTVLTGTYERDMQLPLPEGHTEDQCRFFWASCENHYGANTGDIVPAFGNTRNAKLPYKGDRYWKGGAWMVIGIKPALTEEALATMESAAPSPRRNMN